MNQVESEMQTPFTLRSDVFRCRPQHPGHDALPSVELPPPAPFVRKNRTEKNIAALLPAQTPNVSGESAASPPQGPLMTRDECHRNDLFKPQPTDRLLSYEPSDYDMQFLSLLELEFPTLLADEAGWNEK